MKDHIEEFVVRRWSIPSDAFQLELEPLQGGLESLVTRACLTVDAGWDSVPHQFVVKQLPADSRREAAVYQTLWKHVERPPAARMLGVQSRDSHAYLYLEDVRPLSVWPWSDTALAAAVCRELARLHTSRDLPHDVFRWNYDAELARSAETTLQVAYDARREDGTRIWRRLGDLRRVVAMLPEIRARLLAAGQTVIHGDVHPGNVIVRRDDPVHPVALIDWGRSRIGSPLEDVSSWLHSLGCWEPQARRRHDTLLRVYLNEIGWPGPATAGLRATYWLACVSNGVSGAIRYHLSVLSDPQATDSTRYHSSCALPAWERVVRQAAMLLTTSSSR